MPGLLDSIGPTPRNKLIGLLADGLQGAHDFASTPFGYDNPPARMISGLLGVPSVAQTLDRMSYGDSLLSGSGMTTRVRPEVMDAAMAVAPLVSPVMRGAGKFGEIAGNEIVRQGMKAEKAIAPFVTRTMESGGLPAQLLNDLSSGTRSNMIKTPFGRIPETSKEIDTLYNQLQSKANALGYQTKGGASNVSGSRYLEFRGNEGAAGEPASTFQVRLSNHGDRYPNASGSDARFSVDPDSRNTFEMAKEWLKESGFNLDKRVPKVEAKPHILNGTKASELNALRISRGGNPVTPEEVKAFGLIDDVGITR